MHGMELAEGVILDGHYRLRQLLGRGGMGEVWEAEHTRLPKLFAVKFLLSLSQAEPELQMRFKREAEIASRLGHPSIVQVTDFNILPDGTAYIAMERLVGEDLRARLGRGALPLDEVREITRQVASALELAHREGIVHRDLKPENIFLCREPDGALRAKLLDFGISKVQGSTGTRDDRVLGTLGYMAPEQALGKNSSIDGRTDLFSLATIVYEMLTGKGVFVGETFAELCTKVLYHTPPPLDEVRPEVPRPLAVAISIALSKAPADRQAEIRTFAEAVAGAPLPLPGASGFAATLAAASSDAPTRSRRAAPLMTSQPPPDGRPLLWASAASVLVVVLLALFWFRATRGPTATPLVLPPSERAGPAALPEPRATEQTRVAAGDVTDASAAPDVAPISSTQPHASGDASAAISELAAKTRTDIGRPQLSASAVAALDQAERALDRGDSATTLRLARSSLREAESERAYLLMARAYCAQRDVGMVQAMLRNLTPPVRKLVKKQCQSAGLTVP